MYVLRGTVYRKFPLCRYHSGSHRLHGADSLCGGFHGTLRGLSVDSRGEPEADVWFIIVFLIVQQVEGQIIYPRVVGGSVGLPAIWTLFAVIVGGNISGILGMVIFIPIFSVIYALLRRNVYKRLDKKKISIEI